jgi:hypothetical protein
MKWLQLAFVGLLITACGQSGGQTNTPDPNNPGGTKSYNGVLITDGSGGIQTLELAKRDPAIANPWVSRDSTTSYDSVAVVVSRNEVFKASTTIGTPLVVEVKDLGTFALKESLESPRFSA